MTETYISNGKHYDVSQKNLERFLTDHPEAKKKEDTDITVYYNREGDKWKGYDVAGANLEKFKTDFPEAKTKEGWNDYAEKQKRELAAHNKRIAKAKSESEKKKLENQKIKKENDLLVKEHDTLKDKNYQELTKIYKDAGGPQFYIKSDDQQDTVGKPKMIKWLKKNKYKDVDFSTPFDMDESIDESKLDIPMPISVMGVETSQPTNIEDTKLGDNFLEDINKYNSDIQNLLSNPVLDENGKVDYEAIQNAINEVEANAPSGLTVRDDIDDSLSWKQLSKAERRRYEYLLNKMESNPNFTETQYDNFGRPIAQLVQGVEREELSDDEKRAKIYDQIIEERRVKLEQYEKGEIDLTTEELSNMFTIDQGMKDYMQRFLPDAEQMVAMEDSNLTDNENVLNTMNLSVTAAVSSDPRFKFVQKNIIKQVDNEAEAKLIEIRNKYKLEEGITQEKLEKVQEEFTDWYNNSLSERLSSNKTLTRLFKEYGLAANSSFQEMAIDYKRYKDPFLRQIDDTLNRYKDDDSLKGVLKKGSAWFRESVDKLGVSPSTWGNEFQIAARNFFGGDKTRRRLKNLKDDIIGNNGITADTTVGEAKILWRENPENVNKSGDQTLLPVGFGTSNDITIGELINSMEGEVEELDDDTMIDIEQMMQAYEDMSKYRTYDSGKAFGKKGSWTDYFAGKQGLLPDMEFTLEGFLDRAAGFVDQAPHMVPSMIGKGLVGSSAVITAVTGGASTPFTSITAKAGTGFILAGSMIQGAMEYGGTYMDGIRQGLQDELKAQGIEREPTAEEYLEALKNPDKYTSQEAAFTAGVAVTGVEFLSDYITGKLTGSIGGNVAKSAVGKAILGNTFSKYLASVGISGLGGMQINAAQEYLTEGFQEYLGQVAGNYIDKFVQNKEVDNIFTSNLKWDEISEAASMGYKQGELFGSVALLSTSVGLSQIKKSYTQQAEDIAYNIDMRPGSKTSKAGRAAFKKLQKAIEEDDSLSKSEKAKQINELSRIREASMLTPSNVTGLEKIKLMKLLAEQKQLKNEIKSVDNKELSVNKIERKAIVDQQIIDIIKGADERSSTVGMSVLPTGQQQITDIEGEKDSYSKIDDIYADEDFDSENTLDQKRILKEAGGTINSRLNQLWTKGGLFSRDQFKKLLENEYLKTFLSYNPDKDVNSQGIGRQTANLFYQRSKALVDQNVRQKGDTISMSDEKAPQIGDTTEQKDFDSETQEVQGKRDKRYLGSNEKVNESVGPEAKNEIKNQTSQEILNKANKGSTVSQIKSAINNMFGDAKSRGGRGLWKTLGNKIGTMTKGYKNFVDNVVDAEFISQLPAAYIKQSGLGKILGIEKIGKSDKVTEKDGKKSYSRPDTFLLPGEITGEMVQEVKDYLKKDNPSRIRLLQKMSQEFAMESLQELKNDQDFMQKLQTALGDNQTAENFMNDLESQMDQRTLEDSTLDVTTPVKNANEASSEAFSDIVTEENLNDFKDKDVLDKAIEYFDSLEDDYKNTLGTNPIQLFTSAIKTALKLTRAVIKAGGTLKQAAAQFARSFRHALKYPAKLYSRLGRSARLTMKQLVASKNVKLFNPGRKGTINAEQRKQRRIGTIVSHFKLGPEFVNSSVLTGSADSLYNIISEVDNDIDGEIDADLAAELQKQGVPLTQLDNGNFKYDKSQANSIDQNNTLQDSRSEQNGENAYKTWSPAKILNKIKDPAWREQQRNKLKLLKKIAKVIEADIKANPENIAYWASWLSSQSTQSNHPVKALAPITFFNTSKGPASLFRAEHSLPSNNVSTMIMDMAIRGKVDNDFKIIEQDYFQGKLLLTDDNKLKTNQEGIMLQKDMPNIYFTGPALTLNPKTWLRYLDAIVNDNKGGINMNELVTYKDDGTITNIAEKFGLPLSKNEYTYGNNKINLGLIKFQNELLYKVAAGDMSLRQAKTLLATAVKSGVKLAEQQMVDQNSNTFGSIFNKNVTPFSQKKSILNSLKARIQALKINKKRKGLSAFDMDDTLALTKEKVLYTMPDGKKGELTAAEFAVQYEGLLDQGAEFDYSNFDNVDLSTEKGPLAGKALERQAKYGSKDIYVVTARPNASQQAIKTFLDSIGLNIPLENIITLEDGSPQAKADWLLGKAEQGYNDFYFADDSALNVQVVKDILGQIDVKSRVQLAIADKATRLDKEMNDLVEDATNIKADQEVTDVQAKLEGKKKDKGFFKRLLRQFTITASADDFLGLLYPLLGKGDKGTRQLNWIKENLLDPYNKAEQALVSAKIAVANDFNALKSKFPSLKKNALNDEIGVGPYNKSQAIRVYLWNKQGMDIAGMSSADINALVAAVESDSELNIFADELQLIQKNKEYPSPKANWIAGDIKSDILGSLDTTFRSELMTEFNENSDIIFSEKNMNKLEAAFGAKYVEALRDSLSRMKRGSNRSVYQGSGSRQVNEMMDWLNASVGVAMFLNMKSGLLQMLSNVNFVNWGDNNIYAAAKAFMSKDYVPTVIKLMNSDYLTNRRDGLKINVNEAELAAAANKGGFKGMLSYLLDKGFILTRIFDTLAIATGGATFYINRTNSLLKQTNPETNKLYTKQEAEAKAFDDFYAIAEETQQSSNPSKISSQQASLAGRVILSFQNVTMQYNRKAKKSLLDFVNRRRKPGMTQRESDLSNLSSVVYYVGVQNLIFNALQQAVFALAFDEEEEKERNKAVDVANGMVDSLLFGLGFGGAIISTLKNVGLKVFDESQKKSPKYQEAAWSLFDISPVIDSKVRNIRTGLKTFSWNMKEIKKRGWSLDNPAYLAVSQLISAFTNVPLDRLMRKMNNVRQAFDEETRTYERIALILGWNGWNFGLPYWGRESTIKKEEAEEEKLKSEFKKSVQSAKKAGFTKRVPFTGPNSGKPKGLPNVDFVAIKRYDGIIQYYKKP